MKKYIRLIALLLCGLTANGFPSTGTPAATGSRGAHDQTAGVIPAAWQEGVPITTLMTMNPDHFHWMLDGGDPGAYQRLLEYLDLSTVSPNRSLPAHKTGSCYDTGIPWDDGRQNPWGMLVQGTLYQRGDRQFPVGAPSATYAGMDPGADFTNIKLIEAWENLNAAAEAGNQGAAMLRDICRSEAINTHSYHVGPLAILPGTPPAFKLRDMWRPKSIPESLINLPYMDPYFRSLEEKTYCVEFSMPKTPIFDVLPWDESFPDLDPGTPDVKVRGWYFKGDGVGSQHPLVILSSGYPMQIWGFCRTIVGWVTAGFDVLALEHRGFGWSEGYPQLVTEDFFRALDQLETGVPSYGPDDDPAADPVWRTNLLGSDTAKSKPVILMGVAWGAAAVSRAMAMNYGNAQVDGNWDDTGTYIDTGNTPRNYNFLGVITAAGWHGSPMFSSESGFLDYFEGCCLKDLHTGWAVNGEIWDSQSEWPACFRMVQTVGHYGQAEGAIRAYNEKLRGFKKVLILEGGINDILLNPEYQHLAIHQAVQWARSLTMFHWFLNQEFLPGIAWPEANTQQTALEERICDGPDPLETTDWRFQQAYNGYEQTLKSWLSEHGMETHGFIRDDKGVFHIHAVTLYDALKEMGYCVAVDRLWQMETYRRLARGRLAELYGPDLLPSDMTYRATGYSEAELKAGFRSMDKESQVIVSGYVAGINRRIIELRHNPDLVPYEFTALGLTPEPWTVTDVLAWISALLRLFDSEAALMAQVENTTLLQDLADRFPDDYLDMFNDLRWFNDPDALTILPGVDKQSPTPRFDIPQLDNLPSLARAWRDLRDRRRAIDTQLQKHNLEIKMGSYAWAVSGAKTASGNSILYSGPQMGFSTPAIVAEGAISTTRYTCSGMHVPGTPLITIGRGPFHAWSVMVGQAHTEDIYLESPADVTLHRVETIKVAGAPEVKLPVYRTSHGPVVYPLPYDPDHPGEVILGWRYAHWGYEFDHVRALFTMGRSFEMHHFAKGVEKLPCSQHICFADYRGSIAYWMAGRDPVRPEGVDPRFVQLGDGTQEWPSPLTLVPRPFGVNPEKGYFCGWNNKSRPDYNNCQWNTFYQFGSAHRAHMVDEFLAANSNLTFDQLRDLVPHIAATYGCILGGNDWAYVADRFTAAVLAQPTPERMAGVNMLTDWDGHFACCSEDEWISGTTLCDAWTLKEAWIAEMLRLTFEDELDTATLSYADHSPNVLFNVLLHALAGESSGVVNTCDWFKDRAGGGKPETADELIVAALDNVLADLGARPWNSPRWEIVFQHDFLGEIDRIPWSNRSTYAQCVEIGPGGLLRVESLFPLGESGNIDFSTGQPILDSHFLSMQDLYRTFTHRVFPLLIPAWVQTPDEKN